MLKNNIPTNSKTVFMPIMLFFFVKVPKHTKKGRKTCIKYFLYQTDILVEMIKKIKPFKVKHEGKTYHFPETEIIIEKPENHLTYTAHTTEGYRHPFVFPGGAIDLTTLYHTKKDRSANEKRFARDVVKYFRNPQKILQRKTVPVHHLKDDIFNEYLIQEEPQSTGASHYSARTNQQ